MAINQGDLNVDIGAKLNKFEKALDNMQRDFRKTSGRMEAQSRKAGNSMQSILGGALKRIGGIAAAAFATDRIAQFAFEAVQLAGKLEGVERAFNKLNKPGLLDELRKATRGTVTDLELMQKAVRADNFNIPLSQLGKFFQFATERAQQTGESVDYLVNSIVDGIGRKSTLVLDNLGISASELQKEVKLVGDFGLAVGNIIERQMAKGGDSTETTAQKTARLNAEMKNLQTQIGQQLIPTYNKLIASTNQLLKGTSAYIDVISTKGLSTLDKWQLSLSNTVGFSRAISDVLGLINGKTTAQILNQKAAAKAFENSVKPYRDYLQQLESGVSTKQNETSATKNQTEASKEYLDTMHKILAAQAAISGPVMGTRESLGGSVNKEDGVGPLDFPTFDPELEAANKAASNFLKQSDAIGESIKQNTESGQMFFGLLIGAFQSAGDSSQDFALKMSSAIEDLLVQITTMIIKMLALKAILAAFGVPTAGVGLGSIGGFGGLAVQGHAEGGLTTGPHLAMVGDNPSGKEAIIPFEKMGQFLDMAGGSMNKNINVTGALIGRGEDLIVTIDKTQARRQNFYKG